MDETWYNDVTSQENVKKIMKSKGYLDRFLVTMLTNTAIQDPLAKAASILDYFDLKVLFFPLTYQKNAF